MIDRKMTRYLQKNDRRAEIRSPMLSTTIVFVQTFSLSSSFFFQRNSLTFSVLLPFSQALPLSPLPLSSLISNTDAPERKSLEVLTIGKTNSTAGPELCGADVGEQVHVSSLRSAGIKKNKDKPFLQASPPRCRKLIPLSSFARNSQAVTTIPPPHLPPINTPSQFFFYSLPPSPPSPPC